MGIFKLASGLLRGRNSVGATMRRMNYSRKIVGGNARARAARNPYKMGMMLGALSKLGSVGARSSKSLAKGAYKMGSWAGGQAINHPYRSTAIASALIGGGGLLKGAATASRMLQPQKPSYQRAAPRSGPGYNIYAGRQSNSPSGSLTLGLHKYRHR